MVTVSCSQQQLTVGTIYIVLRYLLPGKYMHPSRKTQPDNNIYQQSAKSLALRNKILQTLRLRPRTHLCIFVSKHILFDAFSPTVHTKKPENTNENGDFWKRFQKWRVLRTHRFENALFLVRTGEKKDFWKQRCKNRHVPSISIQIRASIQDGAIPGPSCFHHFCTS